MQVLLGPTAVVRAGRGAHPGPDERSGPHTLRGGALGGTKPRNPRHFDTIEGGRVYQTLLVTIQSVIYTVKAIYKGKTTVADICFRPGGV